MAFQNRDTVFLIRATAPFRGAMGAVIKKKNNLKKHARARHFCKILPKSSFEDTRSAGWEH
jgi:hypothetical protein